MNRERWRMTYAEVAASLFVGGCVGLILGWHDAALSTLSIGFAFLVLAGIETAFLAILRRWHP